MKYNFNDFFPITTMHMEDKILKLSNRISSDDLMWIALNREYGEKERYRVKAEVDESLRETEIISKERENIESIFQSDDIITNANNYIKFYKERMIELNNAYEKIVDLETTKSSLIGFWKSVVDISNIDNAHAMYLSSNNWDFSVFNQVLEKLLEILQGDYNKLNPLLTAGIEDVRTSVFTMDMQQYLGLSEKEYYSIIMNNKDYIRSNGICPFFIYIINKSPAFNKGANGTDYVKGLEMVVNSLQKNEQEIFNNVYECYCKLYYTRMSYDTYEYFGYYSLLRHFAIFITCDMLRREDIEGVDSFKHYISTYQFEKAVAILERK